MHIQPSEEYGGIAYEERTRYIIPMNPQHIGPVEIKAAVITVSTSRTEKTDTSGQMIRDLLGAAGIRVISYGIVPDAIGEIRGALVTALHEANCVIINGGTGLTHDDCTIEAVAPLLEKRIDGFGELFRFKSYEEIGTPAILSRALAGLSRDGVVFCIPGSNAAVRLATETLIIPEIRHILTHATR